MINNIYKKVCIYVFIIVLAIRSSMCLANDVDPRVLVVGTLALYGTIGGSLLGAASLAYNTKPRAIAMGASIGLYVGLLFGGYIVLSHHYMQSSKNGVKEDDSAVDDVFLYDENDQDTRPANQLERNLPRGSYNFSSPGSSLQLLSWENVAMGKFSTQVYVPLVHFSF